MRSYMAVVLLVIVWCGLASAQVPLESSQFWQTSEVDVYSTGMIWYDANNDGYVDVFYSNGNDIVLATNSIYISRLGQLPAAASWYSSNAEYSGHCAVGDINDNGFADFVASNFLGSAGFETANTSTGYHSSGWLPSHHPDWRPLDSVYSFSCALGDLDSDGDLDLALATGEGYTEVWTKDYVYLNVDGALELTPSWQSGPTSTMLDVTWGDVDNDGDLDLAFTDTHDGSFLYYNNNGVIETNPSWQSSNQDPGNTLIFGEVNNDGWLDLIVAYNDQLGGGGRFCVYFNDGLGNLAVSPGWQSATGGYGSAVCMYDFDGDGDDDLTAGRWWDQPRIYENTGATFTSTPIWQASPSTVVEELAWIDIDGDGVEVLADSFAVLDDRRLYYTAHHPLNWIDSVMVDGTKLVNDQYCYDLVSGWVSLGITPVTEVVVWYGYSAKCDLTVANWDTYNLAFANTAPAAVRMYADTTVGWAPLMVNFSDSSDGAISWLWHFSSDDSALTPDASHVFEQGGVYDVSLQIESTTGHHHRIKKAMVMALADTVYLPDTAISGSAEFSVPVFLANSQPVERLVLPFDYSGPADLELVGWDTVGCRTAYFGEVVQNADAPSQKRASFRFRSSLDNTRPPLAPGRGPIINLHFRSHDYGTSLVDTAGVGGKVLELSSSYLDFVPAVVTGSIENTLLCADIDNNGTVADIADLVYLVTYSFGQGPPPPVIEAANVDGLPGLNISDIVYLVTYMFQGGPPPQC